MTDLASVLERHRPLLRYDRQEVYFADSAAIFTDGDDQELSASDGGVLAAARPAGSQALLRLAYLGPVDYAGGRAVSHDDRLGCTATDYVELARRLHDDDRYRNRMYGRWATGGRRTWLQYWFFYFYNDYNLLGSLFPAGLHEGDWEMVQLRLDAAGDEPDLAVYAQHKHAASRPWAQVQREGPRPVVYPARGSHASYFSPGTHWTGVWFDHADGGGFAPDIALEVVRDADDAYRWIRWPGYWGDTRPTGDPLDATSPTSPSRHAQWADPHTLLDTAAAHEAFLATAPPRPQAPPAPALVALMRDGPALRIEYASTPWPAGSQPARLIVALNSPDDPLPPRPLREPIDAAAGTVTIPGVLRDDWRYDVTVSVAGRDGVASASTRGELAAAETAP